MEFSKLWSISVPKGLIVANSADHGEMQHYAAFYLGLRCLHKYPFRGFSIQRIKFSFAHLLGGCRGIKISSCSPPNLVLYKTYDGMAYIH